MGVTLEEVHLKVTKISKVDAQPQGQSNEPLVMKTQTHDKSSTVFSNILNQSISDLKVSSVTKSKNNVS